MRPTVPDALVEELNKRTNEFSASASELNFKDPLRLPRSIRTVSRAKQRVTYENPENKIHPI